MIKKIDTTHIRQIFSEITDHYPFIEVESGIELEDVKKYNYTDIYSRMSFKISDCHLGKNFDGCFTIFQEFNTIVLYIKFSLFNINKNSCTLKDDFNIFIDRLEEDYKVSVINNTHHQWEDNWKVMVSINKKIKTQ
jgi:hypothetical protein